ncbi:MULTISPECIES: hypothetical protein [unclassified Caballeronia]|uniref:hypothetical protein n=1 Tax=unclassified Caballeronia TaxID=2646786 RepID=UPI00285C5919|nr:MULTISPECIES: hypothetical protein [unclassified Caballeronia]MDR5753865.1 hypothetical protein [Caballeronia sp. LZ024]MDR5840244.1 hypothetical protein [Caballeronia sp. LZ031]
MWKIILCGSVIVVASTSVPGQSSVAAGEGRREASPEGAEMQVAAAATRPVVRTRYDTMCGANARRVQVDLRGSIDGGARCKLEAGEEE